VPASAGDASEDVGAFGDERDAGIRREVLEGGLQSGFGRSVTAAGEGAEVGCGDAGDVEEEFVAKAGESELFELPLIDLDGGGGELGEKAFVAGEAAEPGGELGGAGRR